jgi:hypothetical protein
MEEFCAAASETTIVQALVRRAAQVNAITVTLQSNDVLFNTIP